MQHPFELESKELRVRLDEMIDVTFSDLSSEFLLLPTGNNYLAYTDFRAAYEVLKRQTEAFKKFNEFSVWAALCENSRVLGVLRAILGISPPEWGVLAQVELGSDITQGAARKLDQDCRAEPGFIREIQQRYEDRLANRRKSTGKPLPSEITINRMHALVAIAVTYINRGAPNESEGVIHRLAKFDTCSGLASLQHAATEHVPYAVLLYERYIGRPFASHRDSVSGLVGEIMENAVDELLRKAGVTVRKTKRAEKLPGFEQAPDFCIPDEIDPVVVIEAKIASDDGTARDKVSRIQTLETNRQKQRKEYQVVACIDGRGFGVRRDLMRQLLENLDGKVFTAATLDHLLTHTRIREFVSHPKA